MPSPPTRPDSAKSRMTTGQVEAEICKGVAQFELEYSGRGPEQIRAHLIGDLILVRLSGVLTAAELQLVRTHPPEKGRDLLKAVRNELAEKARPELYAMVRSVTGVEPVSLYHDISTTSGEVILVFTLSQAPVARGAI